MTIDKMIEKERFNAETSKVSFVREYHNQVADTLEELQWYKSQDLIKRDNVKEKCRCTLYREEYCKNTTPCKECTEYGLFLDDIGKIPKAEPTNVDCQ